MKKLILTLDQTNWLVATWVDEVVTQVKGEEDRVETTQVWCESYSGHPGHIAMLRVKAAEFGTELDEYEELIAECESKFVHPTDEEIAQEKLKNEIQEAKIFLDKTDKKVLPDYEFREDDNSSEWYMAERKKAREFIRSNS